MDETNPAPVDKTKTIFALVGFIVVTVAVNAAAYVIGDMTGRAIIKLLFPESNDNAIEGSAE